MLRRLRHQLLDRVFGNGAAGFIAASVVGWLIDQVRASNDPERLDTTKLVPGETYLVTTRPPMSKAEAADARRLAAANAKLAKVTRPGRRTRRTARGLARSQKIVAKARVGSKRHVRNERKVEVLGEQFDALTSPSAKQLQLERQVAELSAKLAAHRRTALAKTPRKRAPRTKVFR